MHNNMNGIGEFFPSSLENENHLKQKIENYQTTRIKYEVHGGSLHCFKYCVRTADTLGRNAILTLTPTLCHFLCIGLFLCALF